MATVDNQGVVTMQEFIASTLEQTDALTKLHIEKGIITKDEFMQKLSAERARNQELLRYLPRLRSCVMEEMRGPICQDLLQPL